MCEAVKGSSHRGREENERQQQLMWNHSLWQTDPAARKLTWRDASTCEQEPRQDGGGGRSEMLSFSPSFLGGGLRPSKSMSDKLHCHRKSDILEDGAEKWELGNREVSGRARLRALWSHPVPVRRTSLPVLSAPSLITTIVSSLPWRTKAPFDEAISSVSPWAWSCSGFLTGPEQAILSLRSWFSARRLSGLEHKEAGFIDCSGTTEHNDSVMLLFCYFSLSLFPSLSLSLWRIADSLWWISFIWASEKQLWQNRMCQALPKLFLSISQRAKDREIDGHSLHVRQINV